MIKIIMWIIVAIVIVGGLVWFMSPDQSIDKTNTDSETTNTEITETSRITSSDEVFTEIDSALEGLE
ncbi:MAG: hypothetical protein ACP5N7_05170 [Candidatus Pacearchaeota archaeon]